jgi:hypothetical protein
MKIYSQERKTSIENPLFSNRDETCIQNAKINNNTNNHGKAKFIKIKKSKNISVNLTINKNQTESSN